MPDSPLSTRHVHILLALADEAQHGYSVGKRIEEDTGGRIVLRPGSLYRALHQLLERGLIREDEEVDDDPRRRTYRITATGRAALREELGGMDRLVERGRRIGVLGQRG